MCYCQGSGPAGIQVPAVQQGWGSPGLQPRGNGAACAQAWGKATPTPEQQHEDTHGRAQLALRESLAAALRARSRPRTLLERENPGLLISGSALHSICVVPSLPPLHLPPSPLQPIYFQFAGAETGDLCTKQGYILRKGLSNFVSGI